IELHSWEASRKMGLGPSFQSVRDAEVHVQHRDRKGAHSATVHGLGGCGQSECATEAHESPAKPADAPDPCGARRATRKKARTLSPRRAETPTWTGHVHRPRRAFRGSSLHD